LKFLFVLDGDKQGKVERNRYSEEFGIPVNRLATIDELVAGVTVLEDLLDDAARQVIQAELRIAGGPSKGQIRRYFQERLASDNIADLGLGFATKADALLTALRDRLARE